MVAGVDYFQHDIISLNKSCSMNQIDIRTIPGVVSRAANEPLVSRSELSLIRARLSSLIKVDEPRSSRHFKLGL